MTPKNLPSNASRLGEVKAESCQYGISIPLTPDLPGIRGPAITGAGGNGGFKKILENIRQRHPGLTGIYDVKMDLHKTRILSIFSRYCVEVTALGFH